MWLLRAVHRKLKEKRENKLARRESQQLECLTLLNQEARSLNAYMIMLIDLPILLNA